MIKGFVALVLHAHLPYVRHPEYESFLEERWLFEAISETYIPLINVFEKLLEEGTDFRITMSLTPPLLTMLSDPLLQERYLHYLERLIHLSEMEIERTKNQPEFHELAKMYHRKYQSDRTVFNDRYHCNLVTAFQKIRATGKLEVIASAATHGYLPLLGCNPQALKAQITLGATTYERFFNARPKGIWLPECGYVPEIEHWLAQNGIEYIITESHGILYGSPRPVLGTYAPVVTPNGIVAFGRDMESSKQVWSASEGYPGDFDYREFYRDIGYDLDYGYIKDHMASDGQRIQTGIKYYRITGKTGQKQPYNPEWAKNKAQIHAGNFIFNRQKQIEYIGKSMEKEPILVCPYDAELFGHWWYEGPSWIYFLLHKIHREQPTFQLTTLSEYMEQNPVMQVSTPCPSSWGLKGYHEVWLNPSNDWIYRHLHKAADRMVELANTNLFADGLTRDALNQAARELLLAQSSDWAFIIKAGTMVQYAQKRTTDHIGRFTRLYHDIKENNIDERWLKDIEYKDNIFPDIDYTVYASG